MNDNEKIELVKSNIEKALEDYGSHTSSHVLEDVSNKFIERLAKDNVTAKNELRNMLRKSPAWNEELDALVINGTRTHNPDPDRIDDIAYDLLAPYIKEAKKQENYDAQYRVISDALDFFKFIEMAPEKKQKAVDAINKLAPNVYVEGKKKSRIFMGICKALGIVDEAAGSDFQKNYAKIADEMNGRKLDFKLFVSVGAQHFITMSNPKNDNRGTTLTSCHSFNSTEYSYNNGCSGYARDAVTMIAFTVADPTDAESLNNRKTTRQLFMYKSDSGIFLQSRMYNTSGGTRGEQEESKLYRDLIQREISECEGTTNLWSTRKYRSDSVDFEFESVSGFGGYPDWTYSEFNPMVSIKKERLNDYKLFKIGAAGLCISCGKECSSGLYCDDCDEGSRCEECGDSCDEDDLTRVYDECGNESYVCDACLESHYHYCAHCEEYNHEDIGRYYNSGENRIWLCNDCHSEHYTVCSDCGNTVDRDDVTRVIDSYFDEVSVCTECLDSNYTRCSDCHQYHHDSHVNDDGVCVNCQLEEKGNEGE